MANLPLPQRGQPIDFFYISKIVEVLNALSKKASVNFTKSKIDIGSGQRPISISTAETMIVARYKNVTNNKAVTSTTTLSESIDFDTSFKYPPIVTATIQSVNQTAASKAAKIVITQITTSKVTFTIDFDNKGNASVGVNIIAVGIPDNV
jgi:hypothetical protein